MTWREAPLYVEAHDLARWIAERTGSWPECGHATVASRVAGEAFSLLESVSLALTFPETRAGDLEQADRSIVRLRVNLRLAHELGLLSRGGLRFASGRLQAAGKMIGGWRKRFLHENGCGGMEASATQRSGGGPQRREASDAGWQLCE